MKKITVLVLAVLLLMTGCTNNSSDEGNQQPGNNGPGNTTVETQGNEGHETSGNAAKEKAGTESTASLPEKVVDRDSDFDIEFIDLKNLMGKMNSYSLGDPWILGFNPSKQLLFECVNEEKKEIFTGMMINHLGTEEKKEVSFTDSYKYIDAERVTPEGMEFIGSNIEGTIDLVTISNEGIEKIQKVADYDKTPLGASSFENGFVVGTNRDLKDGKSQCTLEFIGTGGLKRTEIVTGEYREKEDGTMEGEYYTNGFGIGDWVGFQCLKDKSGIPESVKDSYLYNIKTKERKRIPFVKDFCAYLSGNEEIILSLQGDYEGKTDDEHNLNIYRYNEDEDEYVRYNIPGYEGTNFIYGAKIHDDVIEINGSAYLDFIQLKTNTIKRIPLETEEYTFHKISWAENSLSFCAKENSKDKETFYYGESDLKKLLD